MDGIILDWGRGHRCPLVGAGCLGELRMEQRSTLSSSLQVPKWYPFYLEYGALSFYQVSISPGPSSLLYSSAAPNPAHLIAASLYVIGTGGLGPL